MTTLLKISDGTELLNVAHIASFKIGHREVSSLEEDARDHSIGYRLAETARMETLIPDLTEAEAVHLLAVLGKAITKATEHGGVIDPAAIAEQHVRALQPA
ncbi:MAG TPA: hypothetical protein VF885_05965 [Arthrobacter sp.]